MPRTKSNSATVNDEEVKVDATNCATTILDNSTVEEEKEIRLDEKINVVNIAPWTVGFARILSIGDVNIAPKGQTRLSREEVISQIQSGNKLFNGIDDMGSHATIYVDDKYVRKEVDFETETSTQLVLTKEKVKELYSIKSEKEFESQVEEWVKTRAEKCMLVETIADLKLNDYAKNRFCEEYTGNKIK